MKRNIKFIVSSLALFLFASSCSPKIQQESVRWDYTREEARDFIVYSASVNENDDSSFTFCVNVNSNSFNQNLNDFDNILFFDNTALSLNHEDDYYSYKDITKNLIEFTNYQIFNDGSGFSLNFIGKANNDYAVIVHKDAVSENQYVYARTNLGTFGEEEKRIQTEFEEELITTRPSWNDLNTFVQIGGYLAQIIIGSNTGVPTAVAGGITGLVSTLGGAFFGGSTPTTQDVLDKLNIIEGKIDTISAQIEVNQQQLMDELVRTQAMIDQVLINQYKADITAFQTDYVEPIEDYMAVYKDYVEQALKAKVNTQLEVKLYYSYDEEKERWVLASQYDSDKTGYFINSLTLVRRENTLDFLKNHNNIVCDGFAEALIKDIKSNIVSMSAYNVLNITKEQLANDVYWTIANDIQAERFQNPDNHAEVVTLANNVKKLANRLVGISLTSAVDSYISRLRLMFNFAGEAKETIVGTLASLRNQLDFYLNIAQSACIYAEVNSKDMGLAYFQAVDKIEAMYRLEEELDNNYCYYTNNTIYGNFFKSYWKISYTNLGNHPTFHSSFKTEAIKQFYNTYISSKEVDIQSLGMVNVNDYKRFMTRYSLMKGNGLTESETFMEYLNTSKILYENALSVHNNMKAKGWIGNDCMRFLTEFSIRDLLETDSDIGFTCTCRGNPDSRYFYEGWRGNYRDSSGSHEAKYWSGKIAVGKFISCENGSTLNDSKIAAYAQYHESHPLWWDDEIFGFLDNPSGNFYFMLHSNPITF